CDVIEALAAARAKAQLLAVLVLARGNALHELNRNARVVAVVRNVPIPIAPSRDGRERGLAEVPGGDHGEAAVLRVDVQRRVDVTQPVVDVRAGRCVAEPSRERGILTRGAAQALPDAQIRLCTARRIE